MRSIGIRTRPDPAQSALWAFQKVLLDQGVPLYWWIARERDEIDE